MCRDSTDGGERWTWPVPETRLTSDRADVMPSIPSVPTVGSVPAQMEVAGRT